MEVVEWLKATIMICTYCEQEILASSHKSLNGIE